MIIFKGFLVENCSKEHQRDLEWNSHKFKNPIKGLSEHSNKINMKKTKTDEEILCL